MLKPQALRLAITAQQFVLNAGLLPVLLPHCNILLLKTNPLYIGDHQPWLRLMIQMRSIQQFEPNSGKILKKQYSYSSFQTRTTTASVADVMASLQLFT